MCIRDRDHLSFATNIRTDLPDPPPYTFEGFKNEGGYAGTRNILGIITTVQCVAGVLNVAVERIRKEILPKYPNVDDVIAVNHAYGCGVAINAPEAKVPIRAISNLCKHPNFGGELMIVGLGCEKLTPDRITDQLSDDTVLILQNYKGFEKMIPAIMNMAEKKLQRLNLRKREPRPLSELILSLIHICSSSGNASCGQSLPANTAAYGIHSF